MPRRLTMFLLQNILLPCCVTAPPMLMLHVAHRKGATTCLHQQRAYINDGIHCLNHMMGPVHQQAVTMFLEMIVGY